MRSSITLCALCVTLGACNEPEKVAPAQKPAQIDHPVAASELGVVRFTGEAVRRLGLETARVESTALPDVRLVGGEVIVPPGRTTTVTAPVGGELRSLPGQVSLAPGAAVARGAVLLKLVPFASIDRDVRARVERELAASAAQLTAAESRVTRLSQLGADKAVSRRAYEEAVATRDILRADVRAAEARAQTTREGPLLSDVALTIKAPSDGVVRALTVAPGQAVAAGAPLLELVAVEALQVRVPIYAGDLARLDVVGSARVRSLSSATTDVVLAMPISGPPTAAPERGTVDRYFALARGATFAPGERVLVEVPLRGEHRERSVPHGAVIYDASGGAWVYACVEARRAEASERAFQRARIDPMRLAGGRIVFTRGPNADSCVASVGAAEIFGTEFEPGH